jgi:putative phosphoribosyl transferase
MRLSDRHDAGRRLAEHLLQLNEKDPVVLALPRGGVPVGFEIARTLAAPLDLVLVRKIGAPFEEELAIGAIADGEDPELVTDAAVVSELHIPQRYLEEAKAVALKEIERRRRVYLSDRPPVDIKGRTAIIVDDGVATGATIFAALRQTRRRAPARLVLAVPVAAEQALRRLRREADETVCLHAPSHFVAVGAFYREFSQLQDTEVVSLLDRARACAAGGRTPGSGTHP